MQYSDVLHLLAVMRLVYLLRVEFVKASPSGRVNSDGVRLSCNVSNQAGAVWSPQLAHIDRIAQLGPVCCVIAEPVHSRVVGPVNIARDPVGRDVPWPPEV